MVSKTDCAYRCLEQHCSEKQFFQESGEGKKKGLAIKLFFFYSVFGGKTETNVKQILISKLSRWCVTC